MYEIFCKKRYIWGKLHAMISAREIKQAASEVGFDLCGIAACRRFAESEERFRRWLAAGCHAGLGYLGRHIEKRFNPALLVEGARTAVVCAVNYKSTFSNGYPEGWRTKIASYALHRDYHRTLREMLAELLRRLTEGHPGLTGRGFTDSAPLAEKQLAVAAGLGWVGGHSLLVTPDFGSFVLLGELLLSEPCDCYDAPLEDSGCGSCDRCRKSCPTGAIRSDRTIDAARCISCRTVERPEADRLPDIDFDGWIFGCDACQQACPRNRMTPTASHPAFSHPLDPLALDVAQWLQMDEQAFAERFADTPLTRSGLLRIQENIGKE